MSSHYFPFNCPFHSILKKSSFWILLFVVFIIFSSGEGDDASKVRKKKREKRLRNKAEIAPAEIVQKQSEINRKIDLNEKYEQLEVSAPGAYGAGKFNDNEMISSYDEEDDSEDSEEDLDEEIDIVMADVDEAEEEEIEINDSMLVSAVRNMEDNVKLYFGRIFGNNEDASSDFIDDLNDESEDETSADIQLSDEQLDIIAKKIADRLEADVKKDFRDKADVIAEEKVEGEICYVDSISFHQLCLPLLNSHALDLCLLNLAEIDQVINEDRKSDLKAKKVSRHFSVCAE